MKLSFSAADLRSLSAFSAAVSAHFDAKTFPTVTANRNGIFAWGPDGHLLFGQFQPEIRFAVDNLSAGRKVRPFSFELDIS